MCQDQQVGLFYIYIYHHIVLAARISLTLSRHSSQSFIALGRPSGQQPVSSLSCWMYVRAGHPAFARPCVEIHKSTSLMSSSLLLQQCPACLVRQRQFIGLVGRVFTNGLENQGSIPGQVIPKTQKMVLDATLLNTQHYKVRIKGKVEQFREKSNSLPNTYLWLMKREPSGHPRLWSPTLYIYIYIYICMYTHIYLYM